MKNGFPHVRTTVRTGETGINAVSVIVNDKFGWLFRRNHNEHDFGIDGYIDIVSDDGAVTGQCFAVQIKTGKSFLKCNASGEIIFYGEEKHLNYYFNLSMPLLIIIHDDASGKTYWQHFALSKIEGTPTGWKMSIPRGNLLECDKSRLIDIIGPAKNHLESLQSHWTFNNNLSEFDFIHYAIDRPDIEAGRISHIVNFFQRIESSDALCRKFQGRVELSVSGYGTDQRELWEIREVRKWFKKADPSINWFYFCNVVPPAYGFRAYIACLSNTKRAPDQTGASSGAIRVEMDVRRWASILESNFSKLNAMTDRLGMPIEENKRISFEVTDAMEIPRQ